MVSVGSAWLGRMFSQFFLFLTNRLMSSEIVEDDVFKITGFKDAISSARPNGLPFV